MLACRALRQRLAAELDQLDKVLAPRRMQRQPSTVALARRRSAALGIVSSIAAVPNGDAAAGASRIDLSAVSSSNAAGTPPRPRAAIASFKVGSGRLASGRLAQAQRTTAIEPHSVPPAWTALLPAPQQQQQQQQQQRSPQSAIQPAAVLSTTPRPSPFAAAAAVPAPDAEATEQVRFVVDLACNLSRGGRARHYPVPFCQWIRVEQMLLCGCWAAFSLRGCPQELPLDQEFVVQLSVRFQDADPSAASSAGGAASPRPPQTPPPVHRSSIKRARSLLGRMRGSMDLLLGDGDGR